MREFFISDDGVRLHAKLEMPVAAEENPGAESGAGGFSCPLFVYFHGFTGNMDERHNLAAAYAAREAGCAVLRVDLYGHGQSGGRFEDHTLYKWVTNALTVMEYAGSLPFVSRLFVGGQSQGGLLAMLVGGMYAGNVRALVLLAPAWMIPDGARAGVIGDVTFDPRHIPQAADVWGLRLKGDYVRVAQTLHPEEEIARFRDPVLIVQGEEDEAVPGEYARKAGELYADARLVMIPGENHCFDHHLDVMARTVREFLAAQANRLQAGRRDAEEMDGGNEK